MSKNNAVKRAIPVTHCIFCGEENPTSQEHIVPAWIFKALDKAQIQYHLESVYAHVTFKGVVSEIHKVTTNDATSPILCHSCNGSFSKGIQDDASAILKPLITGGWSKINKKSIQKILRWYTCYLMVRQMVSDRHESHTQAERERFKMPGHLPKSLNIWIALNNNPTVNHNHTIAFSPIDGKAAEPIHFSFLTAGYLTFFSYGANPMGPAGIGSSVEEVIGDLLDAYDFINLLKFNRESIDEFPEVKPEAFDYSNATEMMLDLMQILNNTVFNQVDMDEINLPN